MIDRAAGHGLPPVAAELGCRSAAQLFVKWVLGDPAVTVVLTGTRNPQACRGEPRGGFRANAGWRGAQGNFGLVWLALSARVSSLAAIRILARQVTQYTARSPK